MIPGEYFLEDGAIEINSGKPVTLIRVDNTGDRPVQVGSHTHFFEVNQALRFDRATAYGQHLNIAAGTAVRFEPGGGREVELVPLSGERIVYGMSAMVMGSLDARRTQVTGEPTEGA
jgi:urease beta subunit